VKQWLIPRNNQAELDAFGTVCDRLCGFDAALNYEWVDGFLTGLAASPSVPSSDLWLPAMAGDTFERVFADPQDQAQALAALQARLKVLCRQLDPEALFDDPETLRLEPLMAAGGEHLPPVGAHWVQAVFSVMQAFPEPWHAPADEETGRLFKQALDHLGVLGVPEDSADWAEHLRTYYPDELGGEQPNRDDLIAEALWSLQDLRMYWVEFAPPATATIRVDSKPGRNDPCHCGSGKKFKKCHGA
jgi:uncharacterized protein